MSIHLRSLPFSPIFEHVFDVGPWFDHRDHAKEDIVAAYRIFNSMRPRRSKLPVGELPDIQGKCELIDVPWN
jgi:hypothetical protein